MADNRTYYVFCADGCKFEGMTKEQILTAITQAVEGGSIQDVDAGFITKIIEQNKQTALSFWIGTTAEYNAATNNGTNKNKDYHYIITDEINQYENLVTEINEKSTHYDLPSAKAVVDYGEGIRAQIKEVEDPIVETAQGKVISIESSKAPFAGMKLYGETTQPEILGENVLPYPYNELTTVQWYKNNVLFTDLGDGRIQLSGTATGGANITLTRIAQLSTTVIGRKYRVICDNAEVNGVNIKAEISSLITSSAGTVNKITGVFLNGGEFVAESTITRATVTIEIESGVTYDCIITPKIALIETPLISVGDSGSFEVGVYGRNILDITIGNLNWNSIPITNNGNNSVTLNGTSNANWTKYILGTAYLPKGKYKIMNYGNANLGCYIEIADLDDTSKLHFSGYTNGELQIFEMKESKKVNFLLIVQPNTTITNVTLSPMCMSANITDETYEPCNKQTLTMPYTLRSVGDIKDEVDFNRGVYTQNLRLHTITTIGNISDLGNCLRVAVYLVETPKSLSGLCTHFTWNYSYDSDTEHYYFETMNNIAFLFISKSRLSAYDKDTVQAWIVSQGVKILYEIPPIETPISETELNAYRQLHTNKPNTNIFSEASATVDYYANNENAQAVGNVHLQANNDYFKLQQAILSLGGNV